MKCENISEDVQKSGIVHNNSIPPYGYDESSFGFVSASIINNLMILNESKYPWFFSNVARRSMGIAL